MRTAIVLCAAALAVSGCALLPASAQVALLALDGFSFVVSKKSVTDHGLSVAMQKDCALWRGLTNGQICHADDATTMIAETEVAPDQAVADAGIRSAHSALAVVDPVTAWAKSELAYRKSAAGNARPSSADAGPYLTIEPESASKPQELVALPELSLKVRL